MKYLAGAIAILSLATITTCRAAPSDEGPEEVIELSGFSVGSDADASYLSGGLSRTRIANPEGAVTANVPVTLTKRAESVAVQFVLKNEQDKPEVRNKELFDTVSELEAAAKQAGLIIEQREVKFAGGERKVLSFSRGNNVSFVNLVIFAKLEGDVRVTDVVKKIRDVVSPKRILGKTRVADGTVGLVIKNPGQFRGELLTKIFEDTEIVKKGVGTDFEVRLSGLNGPVRIRPSGEGELELWIDYSFAITSIREIVAKKE